MIIRNISSKPIYIGNLGKLGTWIPVGGTVPADDKYMIECKEIIKLKNSIPPAIEIVEYDPSLDSTVTQGELLGIVVSDKYSEAIFTDSSPSSSVIRSMISGSVLESIFVEIKSPFSGTYDISVGLSSDPEKFIPRNTIEIGVVEKYNTNIFYKTSTDQDLKLFVYGSSPTAGEGIVGAIFA